jgi:hypothetical protein
MIIMIGPFKFKFKATATYATFKTGLTSLYSSRETRTMHFDILIEDHFGLDDDHNCIMIM